MGQLKCSVNPDKDVFSSISNSQIQNNHFINCQLYQHNPPSQPYFVPGYTGWTPGCGPQRHFVVGSTHGRYTHELIRDHVVAGSRLDPLIEDSRFANSLRYPPYQDPKQTLDNPHKPLDPYFLPGYTGWTPGTGYTRCNGVGDTYGRMTHVHLAKHRVAGNRLRPVDHEPREYALKSEAVKFYCHKHEMTTNDVKRRISHVPGYTGHLPRAMFRHGKTVTKIAGEATAEFEMIMGGKK